MSQASLPEDHVSFSRSPDMVLGKEPVVRLRDWCMQRGNGCRYRAQGRRYAP